MNLAPERLGRGISQIIDQLRVLVKSRDDEGEAERAAAIKAPLMLNHAQLDERVNASWPDFEKGLKAAGVEYVHHDYEGVQHGFHNDTTPRYDMKAAELAWRRSVEFFDKHLKRDG